MTTEELILDAEKKALAGESLPRDTIIQLLEIDPDSQTADVLGAAARRVAAAVTGNKARIWASIGVDYKPCAMNCRFCSFAKAWGAAQDTYTLTAEEIVSYAGKFVGNGADWITLRTTEDYAFSDLVALVRKIRQEIPGGYRLVANTGILSGMRLGLGISWAYVVLGELTGVSKGLGAVMMNARMLGDTEMIIICMIVIALLGWISDRLLVAVIRKLHPGKEVIRHE